MVQFSHREQTKNVIRGTFREKKVSFREKEPIMSIRPKIQVFLHEMQYHPECTSSDQELIELIFVALNSPCENWEHKATEAFTILSREQFPPTKLQAMRLVKNKYWNTLGELSRVADKFEWNVPTYSKNSDLHNDNE